MAADLTFGSALDENSYLNCTGDVDGSPSANAHVIEEAQKAVQHRCESGVVQSSCNHWAFVEAGSNMAKPLAHSAFVVKQYPNLGLGLKIGRAYSTRELISRCRADFAKIRNLYAKLEDTSRVFFEPILREDVANKRPISAEVDNVLHVPEVYCNDDWTLVEAGSCKVQEDDFDHGAKFRVKRLPGLGLGLRLGQVYSVLELVERCEQDFAKISQLENLLSDAGQTCFEPNAEGEKSLPLVATVDIVEAIRGAGMVRSPSGVFVASISKLLWQAQVLPASVASHQFISKILSYPLKSVLATELGQRQFAAKGVRETAACLITAWRKHHFEGLVESPEQFHVAMEVVRNARGNIKMDEFWNPVRLCLTADLSSPRPDMSLLFYSMENVEQNSTCTFVPFGKRLQLLAQELNIM